MLKFKALKNNKGFTLVEMLVILLIIGVIVAVLVGIMGNPVTQATVDGTVAKTGDDMRSIKDAMDLYTVRALTPAVDDALWTVSELMTQGIVTQIPVPSNNAGTATAYTVDSTTYNEWATAGTNDTAIELTNVRDAICEAFNTRYTGVTGAIPAAINGTLGSQCFGPGGDANTIVWPAVVN